MDYHLMSIGNILIRATITTLARLEHLFLTLMKNLLTTLLLLLATSVIGQTTIEEFNYAQKGYILLKENGMDTRSDLRFERVTTFEIPLEDDDFVILKMLRKDNSLAAVFFGYETMHCYGLVCDPRSTEEVIDRSRNSFRFMYPIGKISPSRIFMDISQRAFWPELF